MVVPELATKPEVSSPAIPHPLFIVEHVQHRMTDMATTLYPLLNPNTTNVNNDTDDLPPFTNTTNPHQFPTTIVIYSVDMYSKPWPALKQTTAMIVLLCIVYLLVPVLGVVNNALVVSVIYRNLQMRTVTNYFIANLAVADILVSILVVPTLLSSIFTGKCIK